jgi:hypothetical protein
VELTINFLIKIIFLFLSFNIYSFEIGIMLSLDGLTIMSGKTYTDTKRWNLDTDKDGRQVFSSVNKNKENENKLKIYRESIEGKPKPIFGLELTSKNKNFESKTFYGPSCMFKIIKRDKEVKYLFCSVEYCQKGLKKNGEISNLESSQFIDFLTMKDENLITKDNLKAISKKTLSFAEIKDLCLELLNYSTYNPKTDREKAVSPVTPAGSAGEASR